MAVSKEEKEIKALLKEKLNHKGEWLTEEAVAMYRSKAATINSKEDVGERRKLRIEFQERYGLLEVEAINILNGYHVSGYLHKYHRIKNLIPLNVEKRKKSSVLEDE